MTLDEHLRANPEMAHGLGKHLIPGAHPECNKCTGDEAKRETTRERWDREAREVGVGHGGHLGNMTAMVGTAIRDAMAQGQYSDRREQAAQERTARERALGLGQQAPAPRTFTREEVLTVLKAQMALRGAYIVEKTPETVLKELIAIFERME